MKYLRQIKSALLLLVQCTGSTKEIGYLLHYWELLSTIALCIHSLQAMYYPTNCYCWLVHKATSSLSTFLVAVYLHYCTCG